MAAPGPQDSPKAFHSRWGQSSGATQPPSSWATAQGWPQCAGCVYTYVDVCSRVSEGAHVSVCRCAGHVPAPLWCQLGSRRSWISSLWASKQRPERGHQAAQQSLGVSSGGSGAGPWGPSTRGSWGQARAGGRVWSSKAPSSTPMPSPQGPDPDGPLTTWCSLKAVSGLCSWLPFLPPPRSSPPCPEPHGEPQAQSHIHVPPQQGACRQHRPPRPESAQDMPTRREDLNLPQIPPAATGRAHGHAGQGGLRRAAQWGRRPGSHLWAWPGCQPLVRCGRGRAAVRPQSTEPLPLGEFGSVKAERPGDQVQVKHRVHSPAISPEPSTCSRPSRWGPAPPTPAWAPLCAPPCRAGWPSTGLRAYQAAHEGRWVDGHWTPARPGLCKMVFWPRTRRRRTAP